MKIIISIFCLLTWLSFAFCQNITNLTYFDTVPYFDSGKNPAFLERLSSFTVECQIIKSMTIPENINEKDFEYYVIQKLQKEGMEASNLEQMRFDHKIRDGIIEIVIALHYDSRLSARVYYTVQLNVSRQVYVPAVKLCTSTQIYGERQIPIGYCHVDQLRINLESSLDILLSTFLTDWRSVNKYIQTPASVRFVLPATNVTHGPWEDY